MHYRREIDGLRALAVLPVILFHADFELFSGGFIGVDVFFVISGYLITSIILSEQESGTFSLVKFYERRARRILPALFFVMATCIPLAWLWLLPADMQDFSQSLMAVSTFGSNILFWRQSGYFDAAAELKPLLHTWSLAVEEQYYVLFPLFLMLTWKRGKRAIVILLVIAALISLAAAQWGAYNKPTAAFFLLPTRVWELAIGALLAFYFARGQTIEISSSARQSLSLLGVSLIAFAVFAYDRQTPFPSVYALAPTLGTALVILFATPSTLVGTALSSKALVGIGLLSYSAYLWHQPLFAFARHQSMTEPSAYTLLALSVASIIVAYFSWRFVEQPFRHRQKFNRTQIFSGSLVATVAFLGFGFVGYMSAGFETRFDVPSEIIDSFERTSQTKNCFDGDGIHNREKWLCGLGNSQELPTFIMFGDSHATSLHDVFDDAAKTENRGGVFTGLSGCLPLLGIYTLREDQNRRNCHELNQRVFDYVADHNIEDVFLIARWTYYTDGGYDGKDFSYVALSPQQESRRDISRRAFIKGVEETARRYSGVGVRVHVITQIPQQLVDPKKVIYRTTANGQVNIDLIRNFSISKDEHLELQNLVSEEFRKHPSLRLVSFDQTLCPDQICAMGDESGSYYFDDDHLSIYGAKRVEGAVRNVLREQSGASLIR